MNTSLITFLSIVAVIGIACKVADVFLRSLENEEKYHSNNCHQPTVDNTTTPPKKGNKETPERCIHEKVNSKK